MFRKRDLTKRGVSASIIQRIDRKQKGARSGGAGYRQEDFFAVSEMLAAAHRLLEHGEDLWLIQNARALVDDVVTGNGKYSFYQLKTTPGITWEPVHSDFRNQAELCRSCNLHPYELVLVVPSQVDRTRLAREQPRDLKRTSVRWFPKMSRPSDLARPDSPVRKVLRALCAGRAGAGDVTSIAMYAFATVLDRPARPERYAAEAFLKKLRENDSVPIRSRFVDNSPIWRRASGLLARFPD